MNYSISILCKTVFIFIFVFASMESFGQSLRIYEDIGGNGGSSESSESNDNTALYVVAGLVIGGLIAYALLRDKDEKTPEGDTTSVGSNLIEENIFSGVLESENNLVSSNDELPVELIFQYKNENEFIREKTYSVGLAVKF